jgi:hypothetical protein
MKKALFLWPFLAVLIFSCTHKTQKKEATGNINTISVIIDDQLWNGEVGDSIRNKFASPVIGLPKEEPLFTINQYPIRLLEGFMTNSRNIIVIKKDSENRYQVIENEFASPQNVFHLSGKTGASILNLIESYAPEMIEKMRNTEIAANQKVIDTALIDVKKISNKFNISLHVPRGYNFVMRKRKFIWLKKEITSGNTSILIYQVPISAIKNGQNTTNNIIHVRDSIGNLYIHGTTPGTQMITEDSYSPYLFNIRIKGKQTVETKGTWELRNDFMSGPFINYAIIDRANNRALILEGFCYAPSKEKRDLMFELEAIIKSVEFLKKKQRKKK